jgi:hypothetical protein
MAQRKKIKYGALQRRALLSADLDTGRLPVVNDRGHPVHLSTRKALEAKGLVIFVPGADYYDLTELGVTEVRRLRDEQQARSTRRALRRTDGR